MHPVKPPSDQTNAGVLITEGYFFGKCWLSKSKNMHLPGKLTQPARCASDKPWRWSYTIKHLSTPYKHLSMFWKMRFSYLDYTYSQIVGSKPLCKPSSWMGYGGQSKSNVRKVAWKPKSSLNRERYFYTWLQEILPTLGLILLHISG